MCRMWRLQHSSFYLHLFKSEALHSDHKEAVLPNTCVQMMQISTGLTVAVWIYTFKYTVNLKYQQFDLTHKKLFKK